MPSAARAGTETFWRAWGEGVPQVLLLHCSLAHSGAWTGFAGRLGLPAIGFDLAGHGKSGPLDGDFHDQCFRMAEDFLGDNPMDIVGHSFGATVALRLALERPESVRRLVLIEPVFFAAAKGTAEYDAYLGELPYFIDPIQSGDRMMGAQRFTEKWGGDTPWGKLPEAIRAAMAERIHVIPAQDGGIFEDNAAMLAPGRLEALTVPVLLVEGALSPPIIGAVHDRLAARLPDVRRHVLSGVGHTSPISHPAETAAVIGAFLRP